ncbi:Mitochondrial import inner membrane translocase subunit tim8 [Thecaphora frezii]
MSALGEADQKGKSPPPFSLSPPATLQCRQPQRRLSHPTYHVRRFSSLTSSIPAFLPHPPLPELQTFLDAEQAKARVQSSIHTFTDRCWDQCIKSSIGTSFGRGEEACLSNCVERFLDTSLFIVKKLEEQRGSV